MKIKAYEIVFEPFKGSVCLHTLRSIEVRATSKKAALKEAKETLKLSCWGKCDIVDIKEL